MEHYITGLTIKELREKGNMTQKELADLVGVSDKTISKWETKRGLPDISLIEGLAKALHISVVELLTGDCVTNSNISSNMMQSKFYVCPICGNVLHSMGEGMISCCGITLPILEVEEPDEMHKMQLEEVEDEHYLTIAHEMDKSHYISFAAYVGSGKMEMIKFYAEGAAEARFSMRGHGILYYYCNRHGLFGQRF